MSRLKIFRRLHNNKLRPLQKSPSHDSRKPVFGFRLSGKKEFCKGLGLCGLLEEGTHEKSPKCLCGNLGDFEEFCKGLRPSENHISDGLFV